MLKISVFGGNVICMTINSSSRGTKYRWNKSIGFYFQFYHFTSRMVVPEQIFCASHEEFNMSRACNSRTPPRAQVVLTTQVLAPGPFNQACSGSAQLYSGACSTLCSG